MDLGGLLGSAMSGGLVGIVGQLGARAFGIWEMREKRKDVAAAYAQEQKRWGHETALIELQLRAATEETEREIDLAEARGAWEGFASSQAAEAALGSTHPIIDAIRALIRPVLTLEAQVMLAVIYFTAAQADRADIQGQVAEAVVFLANVTMLWWFGERAQRRAKV